MCGPSTNTGRCYYPTAPLFFTSGCPHAQTMPLDRPLPFRRKGSRHTPRLGGQPEFLAQDRRLNLLKERLMQPAHFSRFPSATTAPARHSRSPVSFLSLFLLFPAKKPLFPLKLKALVKGLSGLDGSPSKVSMARLSYRDSGLRRKGVRFPCRLPGPCGPPPTSKAT